jgi:hypothetical protein
MYYPVFVIQLLMSEAGEKRAMEMLHSTQCEIYGTNMNDLQDFKHSIFN